MTVGMFIRFCLATSFLLLLTMGLLVFGLAIVAAIKGIMSSNFVWVGVTVGIVAIAAGYYGTFLVCPKAVKIDNYEGLITGDEAAEMLRNLDNVRKEDV